MKITVEFSADNAAFENDESAVRHKRWRLTDTGRAAARRLGAL